MKILVLSDNHFVSLDDIDFDKYDYVIHCGDYGKSVNINHCNCKFVRGNCDSIGQKYIVTDINDKKVLITHGDLENVKFGFQSLVYKALELEVKVVFFGHTHQLTYFTEQGILFLNPGSYPLTYIEIDDNFIYLISCENKRKIEYKW